MVLSANKCVHMHCFRWARLGMNDALIINMTRMVLSGSFEAQLLMLNVALTQISRKPRPSRRRVQGQTFTMNISPIISVPNTSDSNNSVKIVCDYVKNNIPSTPLSTYPGEVHTYITAQADMHNFSNPFECSKYLSATPKYRGCISIRIEYKNILYWIPLRYCSSLVGLSITTQSSTVKLSRVKNGCIVVFEYNFFCLPFDKCTHNDHARMHVLMHQCICIYAALSCVPIVCCMIVFFQGLWCCDMACYTAKNQTLKRFNSSVCTPSKRTMHRHLLITDRCNLLVSTSLWI